MSGFKKEIVTIDKLVIGGRGLARLADGMVVMVDGVLPGEKVVLHPRRKRGGYAEADLVELIEASPLRVKAPCPHFGVCGGCDLQHVDPLQQATIKAEILRDHLLRGVLFDQDSLAAIWQDPLVSPRKFHYRQRIRMQVGGDFMPETGFCRHRSHNLEPVTHCLLAREEINSVLADMEGSEAMTQLLRQSSELELLFSPADQDVVLLLHFKRKPRPGDLKAAEAAVAQLKVRALLFDVEGHGLSGPIGVERAEDAFLHFLLPGLGLNGADLKMTVEPGGFCQVNPEQNIQLVEQMLAWLGDEKPQRVLDCHCGMGNFSMPVAMVAKEVVGCDLQGAAIRSAKRNAALNGIENCRFEKQAASAMAAELIAAGQTFDCILLDPPRQGCADIVSMLPRLAPEWIIYISCDPATLLRDLAGFAEHGYPARRIRMADMFPQTAHMETIALLQRN